MGKWTTRLLSGVAAAAMSAGIASAAGFAVKEQSTRSQGLSFAGASAGTEGISNMYFNPSAIAFYEGFRTSANASIIIPNATVSNASGRTALGQPIGGGGDTTDVFALVPSTYLSAQVNEWLWFGLGVNAPFGLVTSYDRDWAGRYHGVESDLLTIAVSPTIAIRPIKEIAIAGGPVVQYADVLLSNAVDFGIIGAGAGLGTAALAGGGADGFATLEGDDLAYGWAVGAMFEPRPGTRLGVGFRSRITHRVKGTVDYEYDAAGIGQGINAATGQFADGGDVTAEVTLPAQVNIGFSQAVGQKVVLLAEAQWTEWSTFKELRIEFDDGTPDSVTEENFDDQWFFALGAKYMPNERLTLRAGVAFDQGAVPDENRTPRIPDANRYWVSFGASYVVTNTIDVSFGYSYIMVEDSKIELSAGGDNRSRGSLDADVESDVHIFSLSGQVKF